VGAFAEGEAVMGRFEDLKQKYQTVLNTIQQTIRRASLPPKEAPHA
jgi:hypothetical protein